MTICASALGATPELYPGLRVLPCAFESGRTINVCLLSGQQRLLVDAGVASTPAERILPALRALGLSPRDLDWLICTHAHADHLGGIAALLAASDGRLRVLAHALDAHAIADHRYLATIVNGMTHEASIAAYLARCGPDVPVHIALQGGERVDLGGLTLQVIHAPGHTSGNLALFEPAGGALIQGESVMAAPPPGPDGRRATWHLGSDPVAHRQALERLRALPFTWFISSHEPPVDGAEGRQRISTALAELDAFFEAVRNAAGGACDNVAALVEAVAAAGRYQRSPTLESQVAAVLLGA